MSDPDALYHRLFSHPLMVEQLVRDFLPQAMAAGVDFHAMEKVAAKFYAGKGERREGDVIWRLPTGGGDIYLYLLLEFQSRSDWWMAVRTQVYQGLLWQHIVAEQKLKAGDRLPPLLLVVLYNGEPRWTAPTDTVELVALPADSPLWPWQPQVRYHLLDMGAFVGTDLAERESLTSLLFRLEQRQEPATLVGLIDETITWFRRHPGYDELKRLFTELVKQALSGAGVAAPIPDDLQESRTMLSTLGASWKKQWKAEGVAEGLAEGVAIGQSKGKGEMLIRQMRHRFGALAPEVEVRIQAADGAELDDWSERILDAQTPDDVFADDPSH